jgi:uncharacterized protein (TIGR02284 family)
VRKKDVDQIGSGEAAQEGVMAEHNARWVLNHLIETCLDGERGFLFATAHVEDASLKSLFLDLATQRARFADELLPHAERLGGGTAGDGSKAGALHRGWMTLKSVVSNDQDRTIIEEAERGEEAAVAAYKDALEGMLPPTVRELVERQYAEIRTSLDCVKACLYV